MINIINDFSFKFNSSVKLNFDGGDLTSDSGSEGPGFESQRSH